MHEQTNPHLEMAKRALDLQIYDFSVEDKRKAEKLLELERFKAESSLAASRVLKKVEVYGGKNCQPAQQQARNINVDVPIFDATHHS